MYWFNTAFMQNKADQSKEALFFFVRFNFQIPGWIEKKYSYIDDKFIYDFFNFATSAEAVSNKFGSCFEKAGVFTNIADHL